MEVAGEGWTLPTDLVYDRIMDRPHQSRVTFQEYLAWSDEHRWEIIDGKPFLMSPAPRPSHQRLVTSLWAAISKRVKSSTCEAFVAPIDVKLSESNVVQPDVVVVCRPQQVTETHIEGAPTLVIEILSPSSLRHDRIRKLNLYAQFAVPEYWIVTPEPAMLEILSLTPEGGYRVAQVHSDQGEVSSPTLPALSFDLSEIFGSPQEYPDEVRESAVPVATI